MRPDELGEEAGPALERRPLLRQPMPAIIGAGDAWALMRQDGFGDVIGYTQP
jgi:hypothetical protein